MSFQHLEKARKVLEMEIHGLQEMSNALNEKFADAVDLLFDSTGKVIISGMGKSGHVARKIAATFASTGTPAHFVHPAEASHGDLGMIAKGDVLILLSNSGETAELNSLIAHAKRFGIKIISFVRNADSTLANNSTIAMILPKSPEATAINAPTTSTTMMMALGDAFAVCLLEKRGFCSEDFKIFHPGGKIGANLTKVADIMHSYPEIPLIKENAKMSEAILEMTSKSFGCVAVVNDEHEIKGIITDGDLRRHMGPELLERKVTEIMSLNPVTIPASTLVFEALEIMNRKSITSIFVVRKSGSSIEGIVHIHDCLKLTG